MGKIKDLSGLKFCKLKVVNFAFMDKNNHSHWNCLCDCGNNFIANSNRLKIGDTKSCGCLAKESAEKLKHDNLIGKKYGKLLVVQKSSILEMRTYWKCKCDCGTFLVVLGTNLKRNNTRSCGCLRLKNGNNPLINLVYADYLNRSKKNKFSFTLNRIEFETLIKSNCYYCGTEPKNRKKHKQEVLNYNGIDRLNSNLGYVSDNCVTCCSICNIAKSTLSLEEFDNWVEKVYNFRIKSNTDDH